MPPKRPGIALAFTATTGMEHIPFLRRYLRRAHRLLELRLAEVSVALVGDKRMSLLHLDFMNVPGPTDVLTFPLDADNRGSITAGEIVICVPEAARRARQLETEPRRELLLYALHGMLHLAGFDDRTESGFRTMHRTEDAVLTRLGLGPQFARPIAPLRRRPGA